MKVHVLTYSHKHGEDITVYATGKAADEAVQEIVDSYWEEAFPDVDPATVPADERVERYFDESGEEYYSIEEVDVAGIDESSPSRDAVTKLYGEGIDEEADEVYLPAVGRCRYCSELIQPVVIKSSGLVDWEINGDTGCGRHPDNDEAGTCGHEPLPVAHDPRSSTLLALP